MPLKGIRIKLLKDKKNSVKVAVQIKKMKMKNLIKLILLTTIVFQFVACENKEDVSVFDQNATERLNARTKELSDILLSSEYGWKAVYFTDSTQLGGFTHLFKFKDLKNVDMASDFDDDTSVKSSEYKLELGSTVSLVFTTRNRIHLLSDSDNYPTGELRGQGYKGDFQFLYYGQENGEIIFRTNRSFEELRFVKATAQDWSDLAKNRTMSANLNEIPRTLFKALEINNGSEIKSYDYEVDIASRFAVAQSTDETLSMAIAYTPTGIFIKPALTVSGQKLSVFTYDTETGNFIATGTNNVSATIKINKPSDDYKDLLRGNPRADFGYFASDLFGFQTNSTLFDNLVNDIYTELGERLNGKSVDIYFLFNANAKNYILYVFSDIDPDNPQSPEIADIFHEFRTTEDPIKKAIILTPIAWRNRIGGPAVTGPSFLKNLDDQIMNPEGLYVKKEVFKYRYSNDIYTFTGVTSPEFRITTYAFQ